jgi:glutaminase
MDYQQLIEEVYEEVQSANPRGKVADYIPELAMVDAAQIQHCSLESGTE